MSWVLESPKKRESAVALDPSSIMRFIPFAESSYKVSPGVRALEERHQQGETVLLEGIKTGSANVIARINEQPYKVRRLTRI